eukprot:scaffold9003_cov115-Amphora_coffeaeformis.AAC.2
MELGTDDIMKFQSMIGAVQWTESLSRFDVVHAVISIVGELFASIRTGIPDWENAFPEPIKYDLPLRSLRIVTFLAELNGLHLTGGDIGNAYLEAYTKEKVCTIAGPEFGQLQGHMLIIDKASYGLRTSGARFHAKFADTLRTLGFTPTYADPDVWIRDGGDCYEYIVVYVGDIFTALKEPVIFYDAIQSEPWNYKLKNVEEPKYHLGGDFFRDSDGTFCYGAQTYVKRMSENYEQLFGEPPKEYHSPMDIERHQYTPYR